MQTCRHADMHRCIHAYMQTCRHAQMHRCTHHMIAQPHAFTIVTTSNSTATLGIFSSSSLSEGRMHSKKAVFRWLCYLPPSRASDHESELSP